MTKIQSFKEFTTESNATPINESGVWTIDKYFGQSSIVPDSFRDVTSRKDSVIIRKMEEDLADHLNAFWKKWRIPYRIDLHKKRYTYFPSAD